jgi:uncharacterized membrane protein YphA (DoxX/SURF4 family)
MSCLFSLIDGVGGIANQIAALATRVVLGQAFALTGWSKLIHFDRTVQFFTGLGIPTPAFNAGLVGGLEFLGGLLLILGCGTRAIACALLCTMTVAMFTADRADVLGAVGFTVTEDATGNVITSGWTWDAFLSPEKRLIDIAAFFFALFLLWLIARGPGWLSVDGMIRAALRGTDTVNKTEKPKKDA